MIAQLAADFGLTEIEAREAYFYFSMWKQGVVAWDRLESRLSEDQVILVEYLVSCY